MPRGRPKNSNQVKNQKIDQDDVIDLTPEQIAAPPIGRKITVEKKVFSRPITAEEDELEREEEAESESSETELEDFETDGFSEDLLSFFDADSGDDGRMLRVFQMIKPTAGAKFTKGGSIFRGELPYSRTFLKDVQDTYGGGVFRLQVVGEWIDQVSGKSRFGIIKSKSVTISAPPIPKIMGDDNQSPYQGHGQNQAQVPYFIQNPTPNPVEQIPPKTTKEELRDIVEVVTMIDKIRGDRHDEPQQQPVNVTDPDIAALNLLSKNPDAMERITTGLGKFLFGGKPEIEEVTWAAVGMEAVKTGQASEIIAALMREVMGPIKSLFGGNNGQAQMAPANVPQGSGLDSPRPEFRPNAQPQEIAQGGASTEQTNEQSDRNAASGEIAGQQTTPEIQALNLLLDHCAKKIPAKVAFERLLAYADKVNEMAPEYSIDGYLSLFGLMPSEQVFEFLKTNIPGSEQVTSLEHAEAWTKEIQVLLKDHQERMNEEE